MTRQQILQADLLDILFEGRNKLYGAYQLRKSYPQQLGKALFFAMTSVVLLVIILQPSDGPARQREAFDGVELTVVDALPPEVKKPELPKPPPSQLPEVKQQRFIDNIKIVQKAVLNEMLPIDAFNEAAISAKTVESGIVADLPVPPAATAAEAPAKTAASDPQQEVAPDKQPAFPGGMQAWLQFLSRNLRSPEEMQAGERKTALIRFHVAEDGSVTGFQVLQSAGVAFDDVVIRVLKKMPKWMPAVKAGQPVSVSFTQAVTFVGEEE
jgi:protein TonB